MSANYLLITCSWESIAKQHDTYTYMYMHHNLHKLKHSIMTLVSAAESDT